MIFLRGWIVHLIIVHFVDDTLLHPLLHFNTTIIIIKTLRVVRKQEQTSSGQRRKK